MAHTPGQFDYVGHDCYGGDHDDYAARYDDDEDDEADYNDDTGDDDDDDVDPYMICTVHVCPWPAVTVQDLLCHKRLPILNTLVLKAFFLGVAMPQWRMSLGAIGPWGSDAPMANRNYGKLS